MFRQATRTKVKLMHFAVHHRHFFPAEVARSAGMLIGIRPCRRWRTDRGLQSENRRFEIDSNGGDQRSRPKQSRAQAEQAPIAMVPQSRGDDAQTDEAQDNPECHDPVTGARGHILVFRQRTL